MDSILGPLMKSLSPDDLSTLGKLVGTDSNGAKSILGAVVPLLTGAIAKTAAQPGGANVVMKILGEGQFEAEADDIGGYLRNPDVSGGADLVSTLLGSQRGDMTEMAARKTGFSTEVIGRVLMLIAPVVLGFIAKTLRQQNMDASALTALLGERPETAPPEAPDVLGLRRSPIGTAAAGRGFLGRLRRLFGG